MTARNERPSAGCRRRALAVSSGLLSALVTGCHLWIQIPQYSVTKPPSAGHLIAGVSRIDITPPSGYPMGGHSLGGRVSRGHWGRLYARAFYLRDAEGHSVAFVSADIWAITAGLQEDVAQLANKGLPADGTTMTAEEHRRYRNAGILAPCPGIRSHADIGRYNLVLAATHTHQSPGNFHSSVFYNGFASSYSGFAREQFDFLSVRIACAVTLAAEDAENHASDPATLTWSETPNSDGLVRNRAVASLKRDGDKIMKRLLTLGPSNRPGCEASGLDLSDGCLRERAVDATLTKLTINRSSVPVGSMVFFAMHPTALSDHVAANSPDLAGFAMAYIEDSERQSGHKEFVAGFFNGAEGDISPAWGRQDSEDVLRLALRLANAAINTTHQTVDDSTARVAAARASARQTQFCGGARPIMGIATLGGAEDGRSFAFDTGWRSLERTTRLKKSFLARLWSHFWRLHYFGLNPDQKPKIPGLDFKDLPGIGLTGIIAPASDYPPEVPVSLLRVGSHSIAAVPFEMTSAAGLELKDRLSVDGVASPVVVGLANEYLSYLTTALEYDEQDYEGASTLYGRKSLECLAKLISPKSVNEEASVPSRKFDAGAGPAFDVKLGPEFWGRNGQFQDAALESPFLLESHIPERLPRFEWVHCHEDDGVQLFTQVAGLWKLDKTEAGGELLVELVDGREGTGVDHRVHHRTWAVVWLHRPWEDLHVLHVFRVTPRPYEPGSPGRCEPTPICSAAFTLTQLKASKPGTVAYAPCPPL